MSRMGMLDKYGGGVFSNWPDDASKVTPVDITNVWDWMYEAPQRFNVADFPAVVVPWERAWFEFRTSANSNLRKSGVTGVGAYVHSGRRQPTWDVDPRIEWQSVIRVFVEYRKCRMLEVLTSVVCVDSSGMVLMDMFETSIPRQIVAMHSSEREAEEGMQEVVNFALPPVLFSISLLNCKNVHAVDVEIPAKVLAKRLKNAKPPGITYKTLAIDPMRKQVRAEVKDGETEVQRALHIARGHFRTYTPERPLFGRVTGTFWIPMHLRGSKEHGEVRKDYKVLRPQ